MLPTQRSCAIAVRTRTSCDVLARREKAAAPSQNGRARRRLALPVPSATAVRFLAVGCVNTVAGLSVIYAAKLFARADDVVANAAGYAVGLTVSFVLNKRWTFGFRGSTMAALPAFLAVFAVAYAANLATVLGLIEWAGVDAYWSQALGVAPYTAIFYLGSRRYVFNSRSGAQG